MHKQVRQIFPRARREPEPLSDTEMLNVIQPENHERTLEQRTKLEKQQQHEVIKRLLAEPTMDLDDLRPFRMKVVWRIVRFLSVIRGHCDRHTTIGDALMGTQRLWDRAQPVSRDRTPHHVDLAAYGAAPLYEALSKAEAYGGLAYSPPPVPDNKSPEGHRLTVLFCHLMDATARCLWIDAGSALDTDQGRYGMYGLREPSLVHQAWPSAAELASFERLMVQDTLDRLLASSTRSVMKDLRELHGLRDEEIRQLIALASIEAENTATTDPEQCKAMMVLRLEDFIERARESLKTRDEMMGLKTLAMIQGLGKMEAEDINKQFGDMMRNIETQRSQPHLISEAGKYLERKNDEYSDE